MRGMMSSQKIHFYSIILEVFKDKRTQNTTFSIKIINFLPIMLSSYFSIIDGHLHAFVWVPMASIQNMFENILNYVNFTLYVLIED